MKAYIITIIGAALLSALAEIVSPEKWRGYVKLITGLVVISCILSPLMSLTHRDVFTGFDESISYAKEDVDLQSQLVIKELRNRINADIEKRMSDEYNLSVTADCSLRINADGVFEGVDEIRVRGDRLTDGAKRRLCEVYGLSIEGVRNE